MTEISYRAKKRWVESEARYSSEELRIRGFQVMQAWEDGYMKRLAQIACQNGGTVLEVGFGMGISAGYIQQQDIKSHVIVECHPDVVRRAQDTFKDEIASGRMTIINGFWEDAVALFADELFDGILFDTGPIEQEVEFFHFYPFFPEAYRLLKQRGIFTYFSDEKECISQEHVERLKAAGFQEIGFEVCGVNPPSSCTYWKHKTIVAPKVLKI